MLYHREVQWDSDFDKQINSILDSKKNIVYSMHLIENLIRNSDSKHRINLQKLKRIIKDIITNHYEAFECEIEKGKVVKFVIRTNYSYNKDISIVFLKKKDYILIKTCWVNFKNDKHKKLRRDKYENSVYCE